MKVAIFNVKYSPNLGDGLLSECLERELQVCSPDIQPLSIDLAGRQSFGAASTYRKGILGVLESFPQPFRRMAAYIALKALVTFRLSRHFRENLAGCDAVILGGNLLADSDLNFPMKIAAALDESSRRALPVAVYAIGVSGDWSGTGRRLFAKAFGSVRVVRFTVRDERSRDTWRAMAPTISTPPVGLVLDPGLLAARHYPAAPPQDIPPIGFCITDPLALRYHGGGPDLADDMAAWYDAAIGALAAAGHRVLLFSNGSPEDRAFLDRHGATWRARNAERIAIAPHFKDPAELVAGIASCKLVIAHRMHACIAAHAFAIPTIGLRWDRKLDSFLQRMGRAEFAASASQIDADQLVTLAHRAIEDGIDREAHARIVADASADVAALADVLRAGGHGKP